ncbi:hypothetical protein Cni_G20188 [Canna indica]|uniref:Uncharacterized protein n=1 Tax=Canna indica TaxID=4628 RepID=A0AAQ3KSS0_9LILI|nr:hypothetical protein Cni_G20188 [Canna indica]
MTPAEGKRRPRGGGGEDRGDEQHEGDGVQVAGDGREVDGKKMYKSFGGFE